MKIQVLISYRTVYGDAVILLNYYQLGWWIQLWTPDKLDTIMVTVS